MSAASPIRTKKANSIVPSSLTAALDKALQKNPQLDFFVPMVNAGFPESETDFTEWLSTIILNNKGKQFGELQRPFVYYDEAVFFLLVLRLC